MIDATGTFSKVYVGTQDNVGRRLLAAKVISIDVDDERGGERFRREVLAVARLSGHPNVVQVIDAGSTSQGEPYLLMEYVPAGSLAKRLVDKGQPPVADVLRWGIRLCGALNAGHLLAPPIIHRDVKPQNILLGPADEPKLADYGIAVVSEAAIRASVLAFTAVHAAPETLLGEDGAISPAGDIYSLTSTLYELLTGAPAFPAQPGDTPLRHHLRIVNNPTPPMDRDDLPRSLHELIGRGLAKDASQRVGAAELVAGLQAIQLELGHPVTEPIMTMPELAPSPPEPMAGSSDILPAGIPDIPTPPAPLGPPTGTGAATAGRPGTQVIQSFRQSSPKIAPPDKSADGGSRRKLLLAGTGAGALVLAVVLALVLSSGGKSHPAANAIAAAPTSAVAASTTAAVPTLTAAPVVPSVAPKPTPSRVPSKKPSKAVKPTHKPTAHTAPSTAVVPPPVTVTTAATTKAAPPPPLPGRVVGVEVLARSHGVLVSFTPTGAQADYWVVSLGGVGSQTTSNSSASFSGLKTGKVYCATVTPYRAGRAGTGASNCGAAG